MIGIDLDEEILEIAGKNAHLNNARIKFVQSDCSPTCATPRPPAKSSTCDPGPGQADPDREQVIPALKKYNDMNQAGDDRGQARWHPAHLLVHGPGERGGIPRHDPARGVLCRPHRAGTKVTPAPVADHPFKAHVKESRYLKAAFLRVL